MKNVVVFGLGYIGLPTSALLASNNFNVYGIDINPKIVEVINKGEVHIIEPELDLVVKKVVKQGLLTAYTQAKGGDVYLIVVPTPFKEDKSPDISYIQKATEQIIPFLKEGDLYIIESTSPVGTTEQMKQFIYSERPELKDKIYLAYCPERVLPGNIMHELVHNDRVIGGVNEISTNKVKLFYEKFVKGNLHCTNSSTAEMCKLVENSSRDVQIAFANELSLICDKAGVNIWELIELANKHPRVNILNPGCGVGGHCIAVDPYFLVCQFPSKSKIIATAREINNYKAKWCVEKIINAKLEFELENKRNPKIAMMGLSFKPNIDDLRESPADYIARRLNKELSSGQCIFIEPNISMHECFSLTPYEEASDIADIIVFLVAHKEFEMLKISKDKIIIDFCGVRDLVLKKAEK